MDVDYLAVTKSRPLTPEGVVRWAQPIDYLREWEGNVVSAYPLPDAVKHAAAKVAEELLRWVLRNIHETSTHPKLPSLLHERGHADLIPGFP